MSANTKKYIYSLKNTFHAAWSAASPRQELVLHAGQPRKMILLVLRLLTIRGICKQWLHVSSHTEQSTGGWHWSSALTTPMCARVAEMRSPILQMTPVCLLLQSVARKLLVKCLLKHQGAPHCPVLPALFLFWRYHLQEDCGSPLICVPSCSLTMHGTGGCTAKLSPFHATQAAGEALLCVLQWCFWTQRKPLHEAASCWPLRLMPAILGKATGCPKGTSISVSVGEVSTDTLPLYSKYIYNFGITRVLDAQPHGIIKATGKPVIFIC